LHSDYIDINDFPREWLENMPDFTLDIEAKAKELAVIRFAGELDATAKSQKK
jgi:predicted YcjX-like family ATPase